MGNLHLLDWGILIFCTVALRYVSLSTRSFMKGVADFLSANRAAGRYLLTISQQMGGVGAPWTSGRCSSPSGRRCETPRMTAP